MAGGKRRALFKLALLPAALVGSLLLAEIGLRLYHGELSSRENLRNHFWTHGLTEESEYLFDAQLGWVHRPGRYAFTFRRSPQG